MNSLFVAFFVTSLCFHTQMAEAKKHVHGRSKIMKELVRDSPIIVVAQRLEPFVELVPTADLRPNRLGIQSEQSVYQVSVTSILKNLAPKTLSAGATEIRNPIVGTGFPQRKKYRSDALEKSEATSFILFLDGGGSLQTTNSWEGIERLTEIKRLIEVNTNSL